MSKRQRHMTRYRLTDRGVATPDGWPPHDVGHGGIGSLLEQTHAADARLRQRAVRQLCPCKLRANYGEVWDRLLAMARDDDPKVRGHILHVLADGSPRSREAEVVSAIEAMQSD